jgi:hypothetical protein
MSRAGVTETKFFSKNNGHAFGSEQRLKENAEGVSEIVGRQGKGYLIPGSDMYDTVSNLRY